jgi:carboxyl-terminal processing protease
MLRRAFTIAVGALCGSVVAFTVIHTAAGWGLWPNRELDRSSGYVRQVLEIVGENYVDAEKAAYSELTKSALHGLLSSLDPHSDFLEAKQYRELEEDMNAEFGGIGVQVEVRKEKVVVIAPIAGTPGDRAGIQRGDTIVAVDGQELGRASMSDVISRLRGKPGTQVTVRLFRPSTQRDVEFRLEREVIRIESVREARVLPGGIGYLQLAQFSERTGEEFRDALGRLQAEGLRGLILDLRNNPGGVLDAAVEVAEPFFPAGELIVYTQGRSPQDREEFRSRSRRLPIDEPVVVLINAGTASAAEIVAGALKDTGRAVLVGERSFGKGSVQSIFPLKNGEGLRLTTARYYTPSGVTIHQKGIDPQVESVMTPEDDARLRLQRSRSDVNDPAEFRERFGFAPIEDRQFATALEVMQGLLAWDRKHPAAPGTGGGR